MEELIVSAAHLAKTYRVYARPWHRLREVVLRRPCHQAFHALQDVSFDLRAGDSLGIVGENGAGKSTLLKILSGVTAPTHGEIAVNGKVASLLELGMGFHPEFSGRQNIALTAALMGLSQAQVQEKVPEIIAFSELGDFIDRPVKTYSTGMAMRLGFSIAVQMEPDILIIDEALSVGDGYFRKKCMDRIRAFLDSGRTLLFCSHAMYYVSSFCQRALWLRQGRMEAYGPVEEVVRAYENFLSAKSEGEVEGMHPAPEEAEDAAVSLAKITGVRFVDRPDVDHSEGGDRPLFHLRDPLRLEVEWHTDDPGLGTHVGIGVNRSDGFEVCAFGTHRSGLPVFAGRDRYRTHLIVPELPLVKGEFTLYVYLLDEVGLHVYDQLVLPAAFSVKSPIYHFGVVDVEHRWEECEEERSPVLSSVRGDSVEAASV